MKPLACVMEFCCSLCSMKIPKGLRLQACAHVDVCVCVCPFRPASVVFHWGKSTLSISCHVWLPSVGTDNTAGSVAANSPINEPLTNRKTVTRHATSTLSNEKYFRGRDLAKECARRHRSVRNLFLSYDWKCLTVLPKSGETFRELIYFSLHPFV